MGAETFSLKVYVLSNVFLKNFFVFNFEPDIKELHLLFSNLFLIYIAQNCTFSVKKCKLVKFIKGVSEKVSISEINIF